jgi:hypothetical protein
VVLWHNLQLVEGGQVVRWLEIVYFLKKKNLYTELNTSVFFLYLQNCWFNTSVFFYFYRTADLIPQFFSYIYRTADSVPQVPMHTPKSKLSQSYSQPSSRRSKQARLRAMKLRKMYGLDRVSIHLHQHIITIIVSITTFLPVLVTILTDLTVNSIIKVSRQIFIFSIDFLNRFLTRT